MKDAEWIADLLQHGLLRASFIPPQPQRELRELTRYRARLVGERARLVNRIQKILEDTNIKLAAVVTDISGASARAMLNALVTGQTDPPAAGFISAGPVAQEERATGGGAARDAEGPSSLSVGEPAEPPRPAGSTDRQF